MHKPIDEYYLHDHGDGNGWQIASRGPGRFGVVTTPSITERNGVIEMKLTQYTHGMFNSTDEFHFMLSPEEAYDLSTMLHQAYIDGEANALAQRKQKDSCLSQSSS